MAEQVLTDCGIWISGEDFAGISNSVGATFSAETLTTTTFKSGGWVERAGGLKSASFTLEGIFDAEEEELFDSLGAERSVMVVPASQDAGGVAYIIPVTASAHNVGDALGSVLPFQYAAEGDGAARRAEVLDIREDITANAQTVRRNLGAVQSGKSIRVTVHAKKVASAGGNLGVRLYSGDSLTDSTPTEQGTALSISATGVYEISADGAITDSWWNLAYTASGGADWDVAVAAEIA